MSGLSGTGNIQDYLDVAQEAPSDCSGTPPNPSCWVNLYCSIPGYNSTLATDICDLNCNDGSESYVCSDLGSIAAQNLLPPPVADTREDGLNEEVTDDLNIKISPNPFESVIAIEINSEINRNLTVNIYNVAGVIVKAVDYSTMAGTQVFYINDMDKLASGVYYIRITDVDNKDLKSFPIVKQ